MTAASALEFTEVQVAPALALQLAGHCGSDPAAISAALRNAFEQLYRFARGNGLAMSGPPRAIYTAYGANGVSFITALPVGPVPDAPPGEPPIRLETLPAVHAFRFVHHGPYQNLSQTYGRIAALLTEKGMMHSEADWQRFMPMWEEYPNDPETTSPADLITHIYLPAEPIED